MSAGENQPYFHVALNLPHAGRVARRIVPLLPTSAEATGGDAEAARSTSLELVELLEPCLESDDNPAGVVSVRLRDRAAILGRQLVEQIERGGFGHDRLGQCIRNFFECLELGREGAEISLRAGEDPRSMQRPV